MGSHSVPVMSLCQDFPPPPPPLPNLEESRCQACQQHSTSFNLILQRNMSVIIGILAIIVLIFFIVIIFTYLLGRRKRRHSRRPFLEYSEDQFKSLTEARLFYVKNQPTKHKTVENSYSFQEISPTNKCNNVYVKIGD